MTFDQPDVGGSRAMQQTYFFVRGTGSAQTVVMVDGLMTNGLMGDGAVNAYHNEAMTQEAVYMTSGGNAETMTAGVNLNLVPKDGGNRFTGGFKYAKSPSSWQGDNLTDELKSYDVRSVDRVSNFQEMNAELGGPILKDKLWFFGAYRRAYYDKFVPNTYDLPAGVAPPVGFAACLQTGLVRAGRVAREDGQPDRASHLAGVPEEQVRRLLRPRPAPARRGDDQQHRPGAPPRWCGTRRSSRPGRPSGPRRCRRSSCSRPASPTTWSATTTSTRTAFLPSATPRRGTRTSARTT